MHLKINEIYHSIQGESSFVGLPCVFIRTTGCSLRCRWCDTTHAFQEGEELDFEQILTRVSSYGIPLVELTGGEPLDQEPSYDLLHELCEKGYTVLIETSGHRPIETIDPRVHRIVDVKCPSSRMQKMNRLENLQHVNKKDEVKFVIANREDFDWAAQMVKEHDLVNRTRPLFSPVFGELEGRQLADWIVLDKLQVRFQTQLHKSLWGDRLGT